MTDESTGGTAIVAMLEAEHARITAQPGYDSQRTIWLTDLIGRARALTRPPAQAGAASVETYKSAADCPLGDAHGSASTYGSPDGVDMCDFCGFPADDRPAASGEIPGGMVEADWTQMARDAAASVRPNSPWAGRVRDGMRDDGDEVRSAMAAIAAVRALSTLKASAETGEWISKADALAVVARCTPAAAGGHFSHTNSMRCIADDIARGIAALSAAPSAPATEAGDAEARIAYAEGAMWQALQDNGPPNRLLDYVIASLGHLSDGLHDTKSSWAEYAARLYRTTSEKVDAFRLEQLSHTLATPTDQVKDDGTGSFIRDSTKADG